MITGAESEDTIQYYKMSNTTSSTLMLPTTRSPRFIEHVSSRCQTDRHMTEQVKSESKKLKKNISLQKQTTMSPSLLKRNREPNLGSFAVSGDLDPNPEPENNENIARKKKFNGFGNFPIELTSKNSSRDKLSNQCSIEDFDFINWNSPGDEEENLSKHESTDEQKHGGIDTILDIGEILDSIQAQNPSFNEFIKEREENNKRKLTQTSSFSNYLRLPFAERADSIINVTEQLSLIKRNLN